MAEKGNEQGGMPKVSKFEGTLLSGIGALSLANAEVNMPEVLEAPTATIEHREAKEGETDWGGFFEFVPIVKDDGHGNLTQDWGRLFEPGYFGVTTETEQPKSLRIVVPYQFARFFNVGEPVSPEDYLKLQESMREQILEQTAENVHGLSWDKEHYLENLANEGMRGSVSSITVFGETSPEASGVASIRRIDQENIELGELRASDADMQVREVLQQLGFTVPEDASRIFSAESQFSPEEEARLVEIAGANSKHGGPETAIYRLLSEYNSGQISDPLVQEELDSIVGSKRKVEIEIELKDGTKSAYLIPAFVPLLLVGFLPRLRRKEGEPSPEPRTPRERIIDTGLPQDGRNTDAYVNDVAVDLFKNFDFYEPVIDAHVASKNPDVNEMTHDLLDLWTENDNAIREKAGLKAEPHHATRPRQVFYANLHAQALRRVILDARELQSPASHVFGSQETRQGMTDAMRAEIARQQVVERT